MHTFKSQTPQELLKEVAEFLRMRGLQAGLPAHPTFKNTIKRCNWARAQEEALDSVAKELDSATIV